MTDRIEELLGLLAAEDEENEEEREDVLAQKREAVVNWRSVAAGEAARPELIPGETDDVGTGDRSGGRTAGEIISERPGLTAGEAAAERAQAVGELWKDGPVWTVRGVKPEMDEVQRTEAAARTARAEDVLLPSRDGGLIWTGMERAVRDGIAGLALEGVRRSEPARVGLEQAGLKGLYRQTVQGLRPAAPALPPEQAGRMARAQEPGSAASLAVDELDRAVRRDSRRYDGGMSIY